ncbi:carbohydrate ABC transporter permease [Aquibacillus koreensis]|uniref:Carbohydrate ABC transporter permease n=1 Tax=Aquibacillus koreensis TaxID=279446 RepID=A0A9X4AJ06_9BACI|nr:carbohydrate ABC transporter permease [Aquibacillus koreensis]MCT2536718.1 carbohydrate ABC transporter permease [Aquibacillus koreensis]MDC3421526.1 carbohydrate ABC transporter permease [Aquibacillus koreensis]
MVKNSNSLLAISKSIALYITLFIFLVPFIIVVMNSFKATQHFIESPFSLPKSLNFSNYVDAFQSMNFMQGIFNSLLLTVGSIIVIVFFSAMTAYLFARFKWRINKILFFTILSSMALPFQVLMIPLVILYGEMDLLNMRPTLMFMYVGFGLPLGVFTFHGFIKGIPYELEEAAFMEGSSRLRTFFVVVFPLLKPVMVTLIILEVLIIWNDYLLASLILQSPELRTLPLSVFNFFSSYSVDYAPLMAGLLMAMIPVLILYLVLQKHIIQGITDGALK